MITPEPEPPLYATALRRPGEQITVWAFREQADALRLADRLKDVPDDYVEIMDEFRKAHGKPLASVAANLVYYVKEYWDETAKGRQ